MTGLILTILRILTKFSGSSLIFFVYRYEFSPLLSFHFFYDFVIILYYYSFRRDWDSSLGQGQTGCADGLTWFSSSSNTIDGSDIAFGSGFQSSSLDLGALHAQLESCCANGFILPKNLSTTADHDKPTSSYYADCLGTDAPSKGESAEKEEVKRKLWNCLRIFFFSLSFPFIVYYYCFLLQSCDGADGINNTGLTQSSNEYSLNPSGASDIKVPYAKFT